MLEIFLGVVAIGGLFLIRKYHIDEENESKESDENNINTTTQEN